MATKIFFDDDIYTRFDQLIARLAGIETQLAGLRDDMKQTFSTVPIVSDDSVNWYEDKTIAPKKDTTPNTNPGSAFSTDFADDITDGCHGY